MSAIAIDEFYKEFYGQGHLDYALTSLLNAGGFYGYAEWLKTQPVSSFTDTTHYSLDMDNDSIVYKDDEVTESYAIGMMISMGTGIVIHSPESSQSMFYNLNNDGTVTALYVD